MKISAKRIKTWDVKTIRRELKARLKMLKEESQHMPIEADDLVDELLKIVTIWKPESASKKRTKKKKKLPNIY